MDIQELRQFAASFSQSSSIALLKRRAAYEILTAVSKVTYYISEQDQVNQAADMCKIIWQNSYKLTKKQIFQTYLSIINDVYNKMYSYNELEAAIPSSYNITCFSDFISYLKKQSFADCVSYSTASKVYEMMELKNDN